jgi:methylated-DNA-protein-cysteine methyltransferase-like protein
VTARAAARKRQTPRGTHARIFAVVNRIPRGRVASYGEVARRAGLAGQARLVGYALHASAGDVLPWHRVVNVRGELSLARLSPDGALTQRMRLEREGVSFDARGRVRMERHRWVAKHERRTGARAAAAGRSPAGARRRRRREAAPRGQLGGVKTNGA